MIINLSWRPIDILHQRRRAWQRCVQAMGHYGNSKLRLYKKKINNRYKNIIFLYVTLFS
jgi:hypothetical protein